MTVSRTDLSTSPLVKWKTAVPEFGLPWTAEEYRAVVAERAVCPIG